MNVEFEDIEKLMQFFDSSSAVEMKLDTGDVKFALKKEISGNRSVFPENSGNWTGTQKAEADEVLAQHPETDPVGMQKKATTEKAGSRENDEPSAVKAESEQKTGTMVTAPLAGIFYRSPKPGEKPYVEVGTQVKKGQTIGLMEAMKIISEIPAPCDGTVREILAADGEFAQFEAPLVRME